jgi:hypothetical protein
MKKPLLFSLLACPTFSLVCLAYHADAQGRKVGGGGGSGAATRPTPAPRIGGGGAGKTPSLSPGASLRPAGQPAPVQPKLPSNFQRPAQLPAVSQPKINLPKTDITLPKTKAPGIPSTLPARPPSAGLLAGGPTGPGDKRPGTGDLVNVNVKNYQKQGVYIRNEVNRQYSQHQWFSPNWYQRHNFAHPRWHYYSRYAGRPWSYWWRPATWALCTGWLIAPWAQPFYYDYGTNVIYRDNYVYINDQQVASAPEYANEAIQLANAPPAPDDQAIDFMPLGTFALASTKDGQSADILLQLAIGKDGLVSGTCFNDATDKAVAVEGRVDPTTQRVALHMLDQPDIVPETGLYNLTPDQTPVLIHFGTLRTQTWFLVRLEAPEKG